MDSSSDNQTTKQPDNPKVVFFGTPKIASQVLENLIGSPYQPQLVITGSDTKQGRGRNIEFSPVKKVALANNIEVLQPANLSDKNFKFKISNLKLDLAILVAYGKIIPNDILEIPSFGFVNIHPSLLPKYRGPSPIVTAILNGDKVTGVSLIVLDSELDHGPIIAQQEVEIANTDTHDSLAAKLSSVGSKILIDILPDYLNQNVTPEIQNHEMATYTEKITKASGKINLDNPPDKETLDRMIRAYFPWPTVWCTVKVESEKSKQKELRIKIIPNLPTILPSYNPTDPFLIQPESKRPMTLKEFSNGYPDLREKFDSLMTG